MKIYETVILLEDKKNILVSKSGDKFQRYNDNYIMVTYAKPKDNFDEETIENNDFIHEYLNEEFEQELQWFQKEDLKLPRLCWVQTSKWNTPKIVYIKSFSGDMFSTGFGESYCPSYDTRITPLTNEQIESLKQ